MNKREIGNQYEAKAMEYLKSRGYSILASNYRCRFGEIDIVAKIDNLLVIVEVKYRSADGCGDPAEAVDYRKQRTISRVAMDYIMRHKYLAECPCRFDVVAIYGDGTIRHIEDAFWFFGR